MKQNSLIEIGSRVNVILRFVAETELNGRVYKKNEPYLFLKDVEVFIPYNEISSDAKKGNTSYNFFNDIEPDSVIINGAPFSRKLASILSCYKAPQQEFKQTLFKGFTAEGGVIFLNDVLDENEEFFVYDRDFNEVAALYDADMNAIISDDFIDEEEYLISFSSAIVGSKFEMIKPAIPFMSLEIQGEGNIDKLTKKVFIYFPKVAVKNSMSLNLTADQSITMPLEFKILDIKGEMLFED